MVGGDADVHAQAGDDLAVLDDGFLDGTADGEDGRLRRVDNGVEGLDAPCAEVGDGDCAAVEFIGLEFPVLGAGGEIFDGAGDGEQGFALRLLDDRGDKAVLHRDGDGQADVLEFHDVIAGEGGVDRRNRLGGVDRRLEDEVVDRILVAVGFLRLVVDLLAQRHERGGIDLEVEVEMGDGGLGGEQARGDDLAHGREFDALVALFRGRHDRCGGGCRSGGRGRGSRGAGLYGIGELCGGGCGL